ncbi:MAG: RHS repeat protein, partial [Alphaproteobacteria bacterium]|nr:RHS repeat protein [Alphaproteobacteria bacterium]
MRKAVLSALAKAAAVLAAFALSGALAGAAAAQGYQAVPSPLKVEADPNGVNVATGKMTLDTPVLSVPAAPNLRFDRVQNAAPLVKGRVLKNAPDSTASSSFSVHTGKGASEAFECVEIDCGSVTASGSTLRIGMARNGPITYREAGTGAVYYFNLVHVDTYGSADRSILHYVSSIAYPNGETLSYGYETATLPGDTFGRLFYRPVRIDSNLGYYITIGYKPGALGEPGWNAVAEATLYAAADPATPLGRLTYGEGTVTDLAGRVYSCCGSSLGANVEVSSGSLQLPGEGAPALQAASHPTVPDVIGSVIRDGVSYSYSYTNLRFVGQAQGYLFDKVTVDGPNGYHQVYDIAQRQYQNVLAKITDPLGRATAVTSDAAGRTTGVAAPEGNSAQVGYDQWGNIIAKTTSPKPGSGLAATTETAAYPADTCTGVACYRPTYVRDALGRQTDFVYDAGGQIVEQTDPPDAAGVRRKTYIAYAGTPSRRSVVRICGDTTTCGTPNELRTEYDYWGSTYLPSVERRIDAARGITLTTTYAYDPAGRPLAVDGPLAGTDDAVYFRYDIVGRKIWEIGARDSNGLRAAKHFYYRDSDDKAVAVEEGTLPDASSSALTILTRSDIAYDGHRNPVRETVSAAGAVQSVLDKSWDDRGRLVCQAQRMNPAAFGEQPGACAFTTQGSQGPDRIARNGYDAASQLLTLEKGVGTALQQVYARYEYTPNGKQKAVTDANGNRAEMTWDGLDRQRRWIFPSNTPGSANPADYEEYGYDAVGNRTSLRKRDGATLTYQYDNLNRVTLKTVPASASGAAG